MFLDSNSGKILLWNNFFVMFFHVRNFLSSIESVWYDYEQAGYTNCYSGCTYAPFLSHSSVFRSWSWCPQDVCWLHCKTKVTSANCNEHCYRCSLNIPLSLTVPIPNCDYSFIVYTHLVLEQSIKIKKFWSYLSFNVNCQKKI